MNEDKVHPEKSSLVFSKQERMDSQVPSCPDKRLLETSPRTRVLQVSGGDEHSGEHSALAGISICGTVNPSTCLPADTHESAHSSLLYVYETMIH